MNSLLITMSYNYFSNISTTFIIIHQDIEIAHNIHIHPKISLARGLTKHTISFI